MQSLFFFIVAVGLASAFASSKKDAALYTCTQLCSSCRDDTVQCTHYCDVVTNVLRCDCERCVVYNEEEEKEEPKQDVTGFPDDIFYLNTTTTKPTAEPRVNEGQNMRAAATFVVYVLVVFVLQFCI